VALVHGLPRNATRSVFQAFAQLLKKLPFKGFQITPGSEVRRDPERELALAGGEPAIPRLRTCFLDLVDQRELANCCTARVVVEGCVASTSASWAATAATDF
jgi:hypothetical protein